MEARKKFKVTEEIDIDSDISIPMGDIIEISDGMDGKYWHWKGLTGCLFEGYNKIVPYKPIKFKVLLTRYPEEFEVEAESKDEAVLIAKDQANFSVWESEVEEIN